MATLKPIWLSLSDLSARLRESRTLYLACDYDGTLTPIAEAPEKARLPVRARKLMERVTSRHDVRLAVLSGRKLDDLQRQIGVNGAFLAGGSGLETARPDGTREVHVTPEQSLPTELRSQLEAWCQRFQGSWVEDKQVSFALHYRAVAPDLQPAFGAGVRRRVRPFKSQSKLVHGKRVFELMPAVSWDKAAAVGHWLGDGPIDGTLLYFGDDTNDEPVYEVVRERGGIAVAVGRTVSRAEYVIPSAEEVLWFLEWLEREWEARPVPLEQPAAVREMQNA
ncbi:MAG TPA: trehalose-phosphatase [Candidatus Limnocylindria bacterium]|nr:trehalose-phosphatase [Candidatus Limnocylindria bacterium]